MNINQESRSIRTFSFIGIVLGLLIISLGCGKLKVESGPTSNDFKTDLLKLDTGKEEFFSSCKEIKEYIDRQQAKQKQMYSTVSMANATPTAANNQAQNEAAPGNSTKTNNQEINVDESDYVKIHDSAILVARPERLEILSRSNISEHMTLPLKGMYDIQLLLEGNELYAIGSLYKDNKLQGIIKNFTLGGTGVLPTLSLKKEILISGTPSEIRQTKDGIVVVSHSFLQLGTPAMDGTFSLSSELDDQTSTYEGIPCQNILKKRINDFDLSLTLLHFIPFSPGTEPFKMGLLGGVNTTYVSENNIYLIQDSYQWPGIVEPAMMNLPVASPGIMIAPMPVQMLLRKVNLATASTNFKIQGSVLLPGFIKDRWSLKEMTQSDQTYLGVFVSGIPDSEQNRNNQLLVVGNSSVGNGLAVAGESLPFAKNEDIKSVRYIGSKAYVVTFLQIDPLHIFDLQDPKNPLLKSELTLPGFSGYLHPLTNNRLFGLGQSGNGWSDSSGIQATIFNISDDLKPSVLEQSTFGQRNSYSSSLWDTHAFFYNPSTERLAFTMETYSTVNNEYQNVAFVLDVKAKMNTIATISHGEWNQRDCPIYHYYGYPQMGMSGTAMSMPYTGPRPAEVNRIFEIPQGLLSISMGGVKLHDYSNLYKTNQAVAFSEITDCQ